MINEKKLIEELSRKIFTAELYGDDWDGQTASNLLCLGDVVDVISNQPKAGEWIPITEKLPDPLNCCIITREDNEELVVDIAYRYEDKFFYPEDSFGEKDKAFTILAWMPLPEPYKPEGGLH